MNKKELINLLAKEYQWTHKKSTAYIEQLFEIIKEKIQQGHKVTLKNIGSFYLQKRAKRKVMHPKTKEILTIPERNVIGFKPSTITLKKLNEGA